MNVPLNLRVKYFQRRMQDYADCIIAYRLRDPNLIARVGHQIRGNAVSFGFGGLEKIGRHLEEGALQNDWKRIAKSLDEFKCYLNNEHKH